MATATYINAFVFYNRIFSVKRQLCVIMYTFSPPIIDSEAFQHVSTTLVFFFSSQMETKACSAFTDDMEKHRERDL